jgi:hypothetical protein
VLRQTMYITIILLSVQHLRILQILRPQRIMDPTLRTLQPLPVRTVHLQTITIIIVDRNKQVLLICHEIHPLKTFGNFLLSFYKIQVFVDLLSSFFFFRMLVQMGDLPKPDSDVLSETLWQAHQGRGGESSSGKFAGAPNDLNVKLETAALTSPSMIPSSVSQLQMQHQLPYYPSTGYPMQGHYANQLQSGDKRRMDELQQASQSLQYHQIKQEHSAYDATTDPTTGQQLSKRVKVEE